MSSCRRRICLLSGDVVCVGVSSGMVFICFVSPWVFVADFFLCVVDLDIRVVRKCAARRVFRWHRVVLFCAVLVVFGVMVDFLLDLYGKNVLIFFIHILAWALAICALCGMSFLL